MSQSLLTDDKLIGDLVGRIFGFVKDQPSNRTSTLGLKYLLPVRKGLPAVSESGFVDTRQLLEHHEQSLIQLAKTSLKYVVEQLLEVIEKNKTTGDESSFEFVKLIELSMEPTYKNRRPEEQSDSGNSPSPFFPEVLAKRILNHIIAFSLKPPALKSEQQKHDFITHTGKALFYLSALNPLTVLNNITNIIAAGPTEKEKDEEKVTNQYTMISHLNLSEQLLTEMITVVLKNIGNYKKDLHKILLAKVLRKAIWNWITHYPLEFVGLCKSTRTLTGTSQLFDLFNDWGTASKLRAYIWPLQIMLLVLCPDILMKAVTNDKSSEVANKIKLLTTLSSSVSKTKAKTAEADVAITCYVDICKAATFIDKTAQSALRINLYPSVEGILREKLFDPTIVKPPAKETEELMVHCLTSTFRLSDGISAISSITSSLFTRCLDDSSPIYFKLVFIKALIQLAREEPLEWWPTLDKAYDFLGTKIRVLYGTYVRDAQQYSQIANQKLDKKGKAQQEQYLQEIEVLKYLLELLYVDPKIALAPTGSGSTKDIEVTQFFFKATCDCLAEFSLPHDISQHAIQLLEHLHDPEYLGIWGKTVEGYWNVTQAVNLSLGNTLLNPEGLKTEQISDLVGLFARVQSLRVDFYRQHKELNFNEAGPYITQGSEKLETALLYHLSNSDGEIGRKISTCIGFLCDEIEVINCNQAHALGFNFPVYRGISQTVLLKTGPRHQQSAFRKLLRQIDRANNANSEAWRLLNEKWITYSSIVAQMPDDIADPSAKKLPAKPIQLPHYLQDKSHDDIKTEWYNITGHLLCLSGVVLNLQVTHRASSSKKVNETPSKPIKILDQFIDECFGLLVSDVKHMRACVMELLGTATSPLAFGIFSIKLHSAITGFFTDSSALQIKTQNQEKSTLFVEQSISLLKHLFDAEQNRLSLLHEPEGIIEKIVNYVSKLVLSERTLASRKSTCTLLVSMTEKFKFLSFSDPSRLQNRLVAIILEWASGLNEDKKNKPSPVQALQKGSGTETATSLNSAAKVLDLEVLRAIAGLLKGLSLVLGNPNDPSVIEKARSKFGTYFTFFTNLLKTKHVSSEALVDKSTEQENLIFDYAIECLSNLLAANISFGLEYFVTMGYHPDAKTRRAFLKVITNILNQGTEFSREEGEKYDQLISIVFSGDLELIVALCTATQLTTADEVSSLLFRLFEQQGDILPLVQATMLSELQSTTVESTLFRGNSITTKLLTLAAKVFGRQFLTDTLFSPIVSEFKEEMEYELDPLKCDKSHLEQHMESVKRLTSKIIESIEKNIPRCPLIFRQISELLSRNVSKRFPKSETSSIGGFLFLRYICPAIISPTSFGVLDSNPNPKLQRGLILATKILQNLANGIPFDDTVKKESYMLPMNTFLQSKTEQFSKLLKTFATVPSEVDPVARVPLTHHTDDQREEDLGLLHYYLAQNLEKIGRIIQDEKGSLEVFNKLTSVLQKLGVPPEPSLKKRVQGPIFASGKDDSVVNFQNFMKTNENVNTSKVRDKQIFFKHGSTKDKKPVFYFIVRRFTNNLGLDMNSIIKHIFDLLETSMRSPYILVVDCALSGKENKFAPTWFTTLVSNSPTIMGENLQKIYFVFPNSDFRKAASVFSKVMNRNSNKVVFIQSLAKLYEEIPQNEIGLPSETISLESDVKSSYNPIYKVSHRYGQKEYTVRITNDYFQLIPTKVYNIWGKSGMTMECIHLRDVNVLANEDNEIKMSIKNEIVEFKSPRNECKQIIQALSGAKNIHKLSPSANLQSGHKLRDASDVPGTLLNIALLNMAHSHEDLRLSAYNMFDALSHSFHFSTELRLLNSAALAIPQNPFGFVLKMSQQLASTQVDLTLEFLVECLQGLAAQEATSQVKHLCLEYMCPWIPNLSRSYRVTGDPDSVERAQKTRQLITSLIKFTIDESRLTSVILDTIWKATASVYDIIDLVLEACIESSLNYLRANKQHNIEVIGSIVNTLASDNSKLVAGKLISRCLLTLHSVTGSLKDMTKHPHWARICVLMRLIFLLSFDNLVHVQAYLPELLHLSLMLFSTGDSDHKATIHGLVINIVHSLFGVKVSVDDKMQGLQFHLSELYEPKFKLLFGIGQNITAFSPKSASKLGSDVSVNTIDTVANALYSVLTTVSPKNQALGTTWHARWMSLATRAAFSPLLTLQPRAWITLGTLARASHLISDDFVSQVLEHLKDALLKSEEVISKIAQESTSQQKMRLEELQSDKDAFITLANSLIVCLTHLYEHMPATSKFTKTLFWTAVGILQIGEVSLFNSAVALLEIILRTTEANDGFKADSIETFFSSVRSGVAESILSKLDDITGMSFTESFSFAVAGNLLKGLNQPRTKENTSRLLSLFLDISLKNQAYVGTDIIGYLAALLPVEGQEAVTSLTLDDENLHQYFFSERLLPDQKHVVLLFTMMATLLEHTKKEHEQLFIYRVLQEGAKFMPHVFSVIDSQLQPKISDVLTRGQNIAIVEAVHYILQNLHSNTTEAILEETYLNKIGYHRLPACASFESVQAQENRNQVVRMICNFIDVSVSN